MCRQTDRAKRQPNVIQPQYQPRAVCPLVQSTSDAAEHSHSKCDCAQPHLHSNVHLPHTTQPSCDERLSKRKKRDCLGAAPGRADAAWQVVHSALSALAAGSSAWVEHTLLAALANGGGVGDECGALLRIDVDEARRRKESGVFYRPRARFGSHSRPSAFSQCARLHGVCSVRVSC